jgi:hypothetical protein
MPRGNALADPDATAAAVPVAVAASAEHGVVVDDKAQVLLRQAYESGKVEGFGDPEANRKSLEEMQVTVLEGYKEKLSGYRETRIQQTHNWVSANDGSQ